VQHDHRALAAAGDRLVEWFALLISLWIAWAMVYGVHAILKIIDRHQGRKHAVRRAQSFIVQPGF